MFTVNQYEANGMGGMKLNEDIPQDLFETREEAIEAARESAHQISDAIDGDVTEHEGTVFISGNGNEYELRVVEVDAYEITASWMGDNDRPVTESDFEWIRQYVQEDIEGWKFSIQISGDELRVYAERDGADVEDGIPSLMRGWQEITDDSYYTIIGERVES